MEKRFTHRVKVFSLMSTAERDDTLCLRVIRFVNKDIELYGRVDRYRIDVRNKTYEFHVDLYSHHGPNSEGYVCGLINGIILEKGVDIIYE